MRFETEDAPPVERSSFALAPRSLIRLGHQRQDCPQTGPFDTARRAALRERSRSPCKPGERALEATPGIEPGCADLQSAASPLRHVALGPSMYHAPFPGGNGGPVRYLGAAETAS